MDTLLFLFSLLEIIAHVAYIHRVVRRYEMTDLILLIYCVFDLMGHVSFMTHYAYVPINGRFTLLLLFDWTGLCVQGYKMLYQRREMTLPELLLSVLDIVYHAMYFLRYFSYAIALYLMLTGVVNVRIMG